MAAGFSPCTGCGKVRRVKAPGRLECGACLRVSRARFAHELELCRQANERACECGRAKDPEAVACARCTWLDGEWGETPAQLLSELRAMGGEATAVALTGCATTSNAAPIRRMQRGMAVLRRRRRVVVRLADGELTDRPELSGGESTYVLRERAA